MYALQLCIFTEVISLVPQLQCVKKGHSIELRSQEECHSFVSKAAMWEWHSFFFKKQIYHRYSFDYIKFSVFCPIHNILKRQKLF